DEYHLAAPALRQHLLSCCAGHQPALRDIHIDDFGKCFWLLIDYFRNLIDAGCEHQNVNAAEALHCGGDDLPALRGRAWSHVDAFDLSAEFFAFRGNPLERLDPTARNDEIASGASQYLCR